MKYAHVLMAVTEERWAMQESKLQAILDLLAHQASGEKYSAEDLAARVPQKTEREIARKIGRVALLPLRGVIANRMNMMTEISGGTSSEGFGLAFQAALRDQDVKAIVLDVDSPGGMVSGTAELSRMIFDGRAMKPVIAHVNATAASAAYWIASAATEMVVTPSGGVGDIGVLGIHDDMSGALEKAGVKKTIVKAGKFKAAANPFNPLDEESHTRMQSRVNASYDSFVGDVARNRGVAVSRVREGFGQGELVDASRAVSEGMADRVGSLEETLQRFGASLYGAPIEAAPPARNSALQRQKRALAL
ncbi:Signal peptide peptidase SppA, 36K type [Bosea sp. LC85]|uniref:S49 family peptidase n=1 Tax=Bosea sp. LC85 TaxID=1502851 RepID=UPI0004E3DE96|nr:S49 family peptidase [Bosea sp. LC85]KFC73205.1 Signal peptide peptidase SppA, 36K type [Bosea sp. LC85]